MKPHSLTLSIVTLLAVVPWCAPAANWPGWRGPDGTGISADKHLPLKWAREENVRWRVDLPGRGNSSPIVWGQKVFVTQAVTEGSRRTLMCFDRSTGKLLWQSGVTYEEREQTQRDNPYCAATPVTDGERVIASFGSAGLYCYDLNGKELWKREFGKMNHVFGNAASPVLHGELCYLNFGPDEKARLIAVNKKTGETVWEAQPPAMDPAELAQGRGGQGGQGGRSGDGNRGEGNRGEGRDENRGEGRAENRGEGRRGGEGDGQRGGQRGGGGLGNALAPAILSQADKNKDQKLSKDEFTALAGAWFDKLDTAKAGKLTADEFAERWYDAVPRRDAGGQGGQGGQGNQGNQGNQGGQGGQGGQQGGRSRTTAPAVFAAADTDKDGSLSRAELTATFAKWATDWDKEKSGSLDEAGLTAGLNAALPRPNFGGGDGGRGGGGGGGRGGGASWSTPLVVKAGDREELIMNFPGRLVGLDPKTGKQLWLSKGVGGTIYTTPVWGEGVLVAQSSGPGGGGAIAVKPGGSGDVTESQRVWRLERAKSRIGSGVIHDGHLYTISQEGVAECAELKTGKVVWEERLRGAGSRNSSWSSMLLAGDRIYVPNQSGDVFVLRASPKFEQLGVNSVGEPTNASLAASGDELFLRTDKGLWCLAAKKP